MKRSVINNEIDEVIKKLRNNSFYLPTFGYWKLEDFKKRSPNQLQNIVKLMLGWDITDYGLGEFNSLGAVLFTMRNGKKGEEIGTPYAEKLIILKDGQRLPLHFHKDKKEDIINRFGGKLLIKLYNSIEGSNEVDYNSKVTIYIDSMKYIVKPGEEILLNPGQGVTITPNLYHLFSAAKGYGSVVCGEVSSINDDLTDNYFAENVSRFSKIEEDEEVKYILCNEYERFLSL
jgi:D-lyxose ketol-isomerase